MHADVKYIVGIILNDNHHKQYFIVMLIITMAVTQCYSQTDEYEISVRRAAV